MLKMYIVIYIYNIFQYFNFLVHCIVGKVVSVFIVFHVHGGWLMCDRASEMFCASK